jgi:hypothetical protein
MPNLAVGLAQAVEEEKNMGASWGKRSLLFDGAALR